MEFPRENLKLLEELGKVVYSMLFCCLNVDDFVFSLNKLLLVYCCCFLFTVVVVPFGTFTYRERKIWSSLTSTSTWHCS